MTSDFASSITDATRSIHLDPNLGDAYGTRAWARFRNGDISGAVEDGKNAIQLAKRDSGEFFRDEGLLDFIAGDYKKAITDWKNAIGEDPDFKKELQPWIEKAQR
jgi:tetratricopeptide (TPR) repeat protein